MTARSATDAIAAGEIDFAFLDPAAASCAIAASYGYVNAIMTLRREHVGELPALSLCIESCQDDLMR
jgi:ABC-type nitrate/sulfonate/bicarbonate transport system substrate-binding protein